MMSQESRDLSHKCIAMHTNITYKLALHIPVPYNKTLKVVQLKTINVKLKPSLVTKVSLHICTLTFITEALCLLRVHTHTRTNTHTNKSNFKKPAMRLV